MTQDFSIQPGILHEACVGGNLREIKDLLQAGADPNVSNEEGRTPLHTAILSGRPDLYPVVEALLAHGADVNTPCQPDEESPLHLVLKHVSADVAEMMALRLLQHGADPDHRDKSLRSSYDYAIHGSYKQVARVVEAEVPVNQAMHELLDQRVEIDARQLILAVQQGRADDAQRCIYRGANVNYIDPNGAGAIHYLMAVSPLNKLETLEMLLEAGVDINLRTYEGDTALNLVIKNETLVVTGEMLHLVDRMLLAGCRTDFTDLDGKDALSLASDRGYQDIVDRLQNVYPSKVTAPATIPVDAFICLDLEYRDYWEALKHHVQTDSVEELTSFVKTARIDMNLADEEGNMCLHWATLRKDTENIARIVEVLVQHGAKINSSAEKAGTVLHLAAQNGLVSATKTILRLGGDATVRNKDGESAEDLALLNNHNEVVQILRRSAEGEVLEDSGEQETPETPEPETTAAEETTESEEREAEDKTTVKKNSKTKSSACTLL